LPSQAFVTCWPVREGRLLGETSALSGVLNGDGAMAKLIASFDWSSTSLGPLQTWPQSLNTITAFLVESPLPIVLLWGPDGVMIYNDAYSVFAGGTDKLGKKVCDGWPEVADFNANVMRVGLSGGTLAYRDQELTLNRNGRAEQVWMNLDYSPVRDETGRPAGVIAVVVETTERVLADRRIAADQERQQRMLQQMPGFVGILSGPDHVFEYVNDAYVTISGPRVFLGRSLRDVFPELEGQGFFELLDQVYATGERFVARGAPIQLAGETEPRFIDLLYEALRDARGDVTGIFVGGYDASEIYRAAAALKDSEGRLRELNADLERQVVERAQARGMTWQLSPDLMGALNSEGYFETSNPAWKAVLGWSEDEVAAMSIFELLHPDDVERTRKGFDLTQVGQPAIRFPNRYRCKDGSYRWISWVGVPEDGMVYCSGRDITEEVAAATERDRIFEISHDLFGVATFDGFLKSINPAWSKALGRSDADLLARPFLEIIHPEDLAITGEVVAALRDGLPVNQFHVRLLKANGASIPFAWSAVPDATRESGIFYTVGRDITEETAAAAELRDAQEALRQSQKMEAVGQLTGGIAHDFNNLLAGIGGSLEMLEKRLAEGRLAGVERYIDMAQGATRRAAALTQRLLAFSRRQTLDPKPINVNRLIASMDDLIRRTVGPSVEVEVVGAGGLWLTKVDPSQLENALLNLTINARDAMPDGGRITIETANKWLDHRAAKERDLTPGQYISLCVTDTGTGMTPEVISRAFDPFYTTKPLGQGTGLGLSMIHGFVRQSGGQIRVYSEVGSGTTMCLYLPRFVGALEDGEAVEAETNADIVPGHGETVLVIDDEDSIRVLMADVLEETGYRVLTAPDGPAGLAILQSTARIDLLITDVGLPGGLNGRQVADAARTARPGLKVLFVTGYAENAVIGSGHLDPGMEVITKPFVMSALASRVRDMVDS
jgi:PAS domain S-box-containing protein